LDLWGFIAISVLLIAVFVIFSNQLVADDAEGYYVAGHFANLGNWDGVYPYFNPPLSAPDANFYRDQASLLGNEDGLASAFLYPPLWAKIAGLMVGIMDFASFRIIMAVVIGISIFALVEASRQFWDISITRVAALAAALPFLLTTTGPFVALNELQMQVPVSALILAALIFGQKDLPIWAGFCLALAASIKAYPALFVLIFLIEKDFRSTLWFLGFGAALGLISILWAGWPAHQIYLDVLAERSGETVIRYTSMGLTASLGILTSSELWQNLFGARLTDPAFFSFETNPVVLGVVRGVLIVSAIIAALMARRSHPKHLALFFLTVVPLCLPLSWCHHMLPILFIVPMMYLSQKSSLTTALFFGALLMTSILPLIAGVLDRVFFASYAPLIGTVFFITFAALCLLQSRHAITTR